MSKTLDDAVLELIDAQNQLEEELAKEACELFGLVGLPRDADGEPIHIGDRMKSDGGKEFTVDAIHLLRNVDGGCYWKVQRYGGFPAIPDEICHVKEREKDTPAAILTEAVMRTHADTLADKDGTDVTDLINRLQDLLDGSGE